MLRRCQLRRVMTPDDWRHKTVVNERIVGVQYAVRGKIPEEAQKMKANAKPGDKKIIECNIGNPQAIGNPYLSFPRNVLSVFTAPPHDRSKALEIYKPDVIERAEYYMKINGNTGGYTASSGMPQIRKRIGEYIQARDKMTSGEIDVEEIFCTDGASRGVQLSLSFIHNSSTDGVLVPVPQYPLYSATLHLLGMRMCPYYLDENCNWDLNMKSLETAYNLAIFNGTNVKAIVIINPGNPTGQVLSKETISDVVDFSRRRGLAVLADEVYQENVYDEKKQFYSVHRGFIENPLPPGATDVPLFSFHSTSKGIIGECGRRGGYTHIANMEKNEVLPLYTKLTSVNLCSNITGQLTTDLMVCPPKEGDASYAEYWGEYNSAMNSYKKRAKLLVDGLNAIPGIKSNPIEGAMYAFPSIEIPDGYRKKARENLVNPDFQWCMDLLKDESVVVVPGSGFDQIPGTFHFRTTILPTEDEMSDVVNRIRRHQLNIQEKYGPNAAAEIPAHLQPPKSTRARKPTDPNIIASKKIEKAQKKLQQLQQQSQALPQTA